MAPQARVDDWNPLNPAAASILHWQARHMGEGRSGGDPQDVIDTLQLVRRIVSRDAAGDPVYDIVVQGPSRAHRRARVRASRRDGTRLTKPTIAARVRRRRGRR